MDWMIVRGIVSLLGLVSSIILGIAGIWAWKRITSNHLHHMNEDIQELKGENKEIRKEVSNINKNVSFIKGFLENFKK